MFVCFVSTSTCGSWETTTLRRFSLQEVEEELLLLFMNHFLVKSENIVGFNEMKLREGNQHQTNAGETWRSAGRFQTLNNIWLLRSWWVWTFICQRLVDVHIFKKLISHPEAGYVDKDSHEHLEFFYGELLIYFLDLDIIEVFLRLKTLLDTVFVFLWRKNVQLSSWSQISSPENKSL